MTDAVDFSNVRADPNPTGVASRAFFCQLSGSARSLAMASALRRSTSSWVLRLPGRYWATMSGSADPLVRGREEAAGGGADDSVSVAAAAAGGAAAADGEGDGVVGMFAIGLLSFAISLPSFAIALLSVSVASLFQRLCAPLRPACRLASYRSLSRWMSLRTKGQMRGRATPSKVGSCRCCP